MESKSSTRFTLIAYKPDSSDYCRGCHMASYSSGHKMAINLNRGQLIECWAACAALETESGEAGYDIHVLTTLNGYTIKLYSSSYSDINDFIPLDGDEMFDFEESEEYKSLEKEMVEIRAEVEGRIKKLIKEREDKKAEAARLDKEKEDNFKKEQELKQLAALKAKYNQ